MEIEETTHFPLAFMVFQNVTKAQNYLNQYLDMSFCRFGRFLDAVMQ